MHYGSVFIHFIFVSFLTSTLPIPDTKGISSSLSATTYDNLGLVHGNLGEFEQAKEYHERALAIGREKLGAKHVAVATTYNNLGCTIVVVLGAKGADESTGNINRKKTLRQ